MHLVKDTMKEDALGKGDYEEGCTWYREAMKEAVPGVKEDVPGKGYHEEGCTWRL